MPNIGDYGFHQYRPGSGTEISCSYGIGTDKQYILSKWWNKIYDKLLFARL